jgi:GNAT superfamily N-acetyltransferase
MTVRPMRLEDQEAWWDMRRALWPDEPATGVEEDAVAYLRGRHGVFVHERPEGGLGGFVEVSLRPNADGCTTSPVGYLEGWWVAVDLRRSGVGALLVAAAEAWAVEKGCSEMASDATIDNAASRAAHAALGYDAVGEVVQFAKSLEVRSVTGPGRGATVSLREIDDHNVRVICELEVAADQVNYVATNAVSLAEAYATTRVWVRAVYADDTPVGFLMLSDDDEKQRYYLWRFMIDRRHQRLGFGRAAMALLEDYVRTRPAGERIYLSYVPGIGGPHAFYTSVGYRETGVEHGGEREMVKEIAQG